MRLFTHKITHSIPKYAQHYYLAYVKRISKYILLVIFFLIGLVSNGQVSIDSLLKVSESEAHDTVKIIALTQICDSYDPSDPQKAIEYGWQAIRMAETTGYSHLKALAHAAIGYRAIFAGMPDTSMKHIRWSYEISLRNKNWHNIVDQSNNIGYIHNFTGSSDSAEYYYKLSLKYAEGKDGLTALKANTLSNIGLLYLHQGDMQQSLKYSLDALDIHKNSGDVLGLGRSYINVGGIYDKMDNYESAIEYYKNGAVECAKGGDVNCEISALNNVATIFYHREQFDTAIVIYKKTLEIARLNSLPRLEAISYNNIGAIHFAQQDYNKALTFYKKALVIRETIGDRLGYAESLNSIGQAYHFKGATSEALDYYYQAIKVSDEIKNILIKQQAVKRLSDYFVKAGDFKKAYNYHVEWTTLKDSVLNKENKELITTLKEQFESEKREKELAEQQAINTKNEAKLAEQSKQREIDQVKLDKSEAQRAEETTMRYAFAIGFILMAILAFFIYRGLRTKQKVNEFISEQKAIVEEKNREITDSINYAKRIQNAILPPEKLFKELLPQSFVLYEPKDIVAGDFYWLESKDDKILFAAADCTGHGVPGAMVSVVCNNGLNRSVREYNLTNPAQILDKTREIVIAEFEKSEEDVKDGMDIALCSLERNNGKATLTYAGANNSLFIIRKGQPEDLPTDLQEIANIMPQEDAYLFEIKANKQPIGQFDTLLPYTSHQIDLIEGDCIYIFSDGYADQFGGDNGKKFKAANLKRILLKNHALSMTVQGEKLQSNFKNWMGDLEQLDDVCIIGMRV